MVVKIFKPYPRQRLLAFEFQGESAGGIIWPVTGHTFVVPSRKETYAALDPTIRYLMRHFAACPWLDSSYCLLHPNRLDLQVSEGLGKGQVMKAVDSVLTILEEVFGHVHFLNEHVIRTPKWPKITSGHAEAS